MVMTVEQQRKRMQNIDESRQAVKDCLYEYRLNNYEPGNVNYYLGAYPLRYSIEPTEYDYETLKKYAEYGIKLIKLHEEWNDSLRLFGADKYSSHDEKGLRNFIDLCHKFGLKVLPYVSSGYLHVDDPDFRPEFTRYPFRANGSYFNYAGCSLQSPEWRAYIYNKMMHVMDEYGVDGIFNDHPPIEIIELRRKLKQEGKTLDPDEVPYDPYTEDFLAQVYHGIKSRGGTSILHLTENYHPAVKERVYDYLNVGEDVTNSDALLKSKNYMPHIINILDKKSQTSFGPDYPFALCIPYLQFPRLNHGRVVTQDMTTAPVRWYKEENPYIYAHWKKVGEWAVSHPNGPYTHGEFSSVPDPDDLLDRYGGFLKLYRPMIADDTVAHVELHRTTYLCGEIVPENIIASLFTNEKQYLVFTNNRKTPWEAELVDEWTNRVTGERAKKFTVPPEQIIFLEK